MAPTKPTSTNAAQTTARTSTRCSTRIFFTLASRSGTTRIVYDLSRTGLRQRTRDPKRAASLSNQQVTPGLPGPGENPGGPGLERKVGARPRARKLASSIGTSTARQFEHNRSRVSSRLTHGPGCRRTRAVRHLLGALDCDDGDVVVPAALVGEPYQRLAHVGRIALAGQGDADLLRVDQVRKPVRAEQEPIPGLALQPDD